MKKQLILTVLFLSILTLFGCSTSKEGYYAISSVNELKGLIKENRENYYYRTEDLAPSANDQGESKTNTSKTNIQTAGIDEGDIVKVDEDYIYYIVQNRLLVIKHADLSIVLDETLSFDSGSYAYFSELYIYKNHLVVIGHGYEYIAFENGLFMPHQSNGVDAFYYHFGRSITTVFIYNKTTLTKEKSYQVPGYLQASRLKGDKLYLVTNQNIYAIDDNTDPRPFFKVDGVYSIAKIHEVKTHDGITKEAFTIFTTITLDKDLSLDYEILLGPGYYDAIYFSSNRLYMTYYTWGHDDSYYTEGHLLAYDYENGFNFKGINTFKGYLINQFAIDAYDGYVRLITTEGFGDSATNRLYVFREDTTLSLEGTLFEGIGKPRETVKSVRFDKHMVTVVTFEQIDPFYVIDLSNPKKPTISGALEVPGYSLYQHLWQEGIILGIGYQVTAGVTNGIKIALYDITNPVLLTEVGSALVLNNEANSFQYGEALYNHKAILFDIDRGYFGFSIYNSHWSEDNYRMTQDYLIFGVDTQSQNPISILTSISHHAFVVEESYLSGIDRAVYVGNYLFALSGAAVTKHNINSGFELTSETVFAQQRPK